MSGKQLDRLVAAGVFVYALVLYLASMAETSPFWDSGEFIAISYGLQVSHPPGAPFYMIVGRFFAMFAPLFSAFSPEPVAFAVNLVSVLSSALTVLLTHIVIVRLSRVWLGTPETWSGWQRTAANVGGAIGALTFAATDSFWFNAVEAEVYGMSMLFTAAVVWLALVWRERTREEEASIRARGDHPFGLHADRLLVAIAYLFGLAIGVHLLNVLALFFVALIVYFEKVERAEWTAGKNTLMMLATGLVASVIFVAIYPGVVQWLPTMAAAVGSPLFFLFFVVAVLAAAVWWTQKNHKPIANLIALSATVVIIGYSSYAVIFIRSGADPPIDENDPETADAIVSYLKREQFGSTPLLKGYTYEPSSGMVGYVADASGQLREAPEVTFPRRHSMDPNHINVYREYSSDMDYFIRYQLGHMFGRYFMWQFTGKAADTQDASWIAFPWQKSDAAGLTPSERAGQNAYWGLPLLLGLLGLAFHTQKDWRRALAVFILFIVSGVGIIVYLNQTPMQPRERDYSYVGAFFAFSLWIGIGATGLVQLTAEALKNSAAMQKWAPLAVGALIFVAVPGWMAVENYDDHDRSGRRIATDFARNMLESTAPNAILFTNGDNDTFPLWYLQEVMGVRRDVRVVNLSLLNTQWYIKQLKNQYSRDSAPLPFTLTDAQVDGLQPVYDFPAGEYSLPVDRQRLLDETVAGRLDPASLPTEMRWNLKGRPSPISQDRSALYVADIAVLDILKANAEQGWERPIYFASTVGPDSELDLQPFFQNEGLARRVVPIQRPGVGPDGFVVPEIAQDRLSKFKFDGLADPSVYLDQNARSMADSYRRTVGSLASGLAEKGQRDEARALLARMDREIPASTVPASFASLYTLAEAYSVLGDKQGLVSTMQRAEDQALARLDAATTQSQQQTALQYIQLVQMAYITGEAFDAAAAFSNRLADKVGDPAIRQSAEQFRQQAEAMNAPPEPAAQQ
ncbi:glycosyltransferase family 117 protein [Rubricoccus marinus]|uniref:DUF2723 domain-containing protein n=1 Tax=Rubricoccus marinus TaxID=716817 RepID=A0A259TZM1_9BACT|nr:DUF2723 domain-containing protein [Rubricoccus marinus]OZC03225.1 hypothetical protein BSZ36_09710 [Rubricoccus marinus]